MRLSVVIPTLNEARNLSGTLLSLPPDAEVIVSDGGSDDETPVVARRHGAQVVSGEHGRARQMNRGATVASGDVLLFVHADCALGEGASQALQTALRGPDVVGGSFRLRIREASPALRLVAMGSNLRARYFSTPYGDQGIFVRRDLFERVGGFPELPFMEDLGLVRELKRAGRLVQLHVPITTGPRHWESLGPLPTTLLNWTMVALFTAGVPTKLLWPVYRRFHDSVGPGQKSGRGIPQEIS